MTVFRACRQADSTLDPAILLYFLILQIGNNVVEKDCRLKSRDVPKIHAYKFTEPHDGTTNLMVLVNKFIDEHYKFRDTLINPILLFYSSKDFYRQISGKWHNVIPSLFRRVACSCSRSFGSLYFSLFCADSHVCTRFRNGCSGRRTGRIVVVVAEQLVSFSLSPYMCYILPRSSAEKSICIYHVYRWRKPNIYSARRPKGNTISRARYEAKVGQGRVLGRAVLLGSIFDSECALLKDLFFDQVCCGYMRVTSRSFWKTGAKLCSDIHLSAERQI